MSRGFKYPPQKTHKHFTPHHSTSHHTVRLVSLVFDQPLLIAYLCRSCVLWGSGYSVNLRYRSIVSCNTNIERLQSISYNMTIQLQSVTCVLIPIPPCQSIPAFLPSIVALLQTHIHIHILIPWSNNYFVNPLQYAQSTHKTTLFLLVFQLVIVEIRLVWWYKQLWCFIGIKLEICDKLKISYNRRCNCIALNR